MLTSVGKFFRGPSYRAHEEYKKFVVVLADGQSTTDDVIQQALEGRPIGDPEKDVKILLERRAAAKSLELVPELAAEAERARQEVEARKRDIDALPIMQMYRDLDAAKERLADAQAKY